MSAEGPLSRPIPLARSILWAPTSGGRRPGEIPVPVFLAQAALSAILEHVATPERAGQGVLGFLLGDLCECPETNASYLVVDAALRLNQALYNDRSRDVVTQLWDRIQVQLEEQQAHLIGWYHTHAPLPLVLSPDDVETHEHYFGEPWQVALLLGEDAGQPAGAFFRGGADDWVNTPLPFYELLQDDSIRPDGKKRSFVPWRNYRAYNPVAPQSGNTPRSTPRVSPPSAEPKARGSAPPPEPAAAPESQPPAPRPPRPSRPQERTSELTFLTTAEDLARPPARRPSGPQQSPDDLKFLTAAEDIAAGPVSRSRPTPPVPPAPEPAVEPVLATPAPTEPIAYEGEGGEEVAAWPAEEYAESEQVVEALEPEPPPLSPEEVRRRRARRRRLWRQVRRAALWLGIVAVAGGVYWWFQPQLPSLWSSVAGAITTARSSLASKWSLVMSKVSEIRNRQRRRAATPAPAPRHPSAPRPQATPSAAAPTPAPTAPPVPSPYARLDRLADSLRPALRAFSDRAAQFERSKLACGGLVQALVPVETRWTTYTGARRAAGVLDGPHAARDQALFAAVDSVERRFEKSGCERP